VIAKFCFNKLPVYRDPNHKNEWIDSLSVVSDGAEDWTRARSHRIRIFVCLHADSPNWKITCDTKAIEPILCFQKTAESAFSVHAFPAHPLAATRNSEILSHKSAKGNRSLYTVHYCQPLGTKRVYVVKFQLSYCRWEISDQNRSWRTRGDAWAEFGSRSSDAPYTACADRQSVRLSDPPSYHCKPLIILLGVSCVSGQLAMI